MLCCGNTQKETTINQLRVGFVLAMPKDALASDLHTDTVYVIAFMNKKDLDLFVPYCKQFLKNYIL